MNTKTRHTSQADLHTAMPKHLVVKSEDLSYLRISESDFKNMELIEDMILDIKLVREASAGSDPNSS